MSVEHVGQQLDGDRREKSLLLPGPHLPRLRAVPPPAHLAAHPDRRLAHQLVRRHADRDRQANPLAHLALDPGGDVHRRAEEPAGAGEIEKGVTVAARLDDRRVDPEDLVQRARGAGVEPGLGGTEHEIGTALLRPRTGMPRVMPASRASSESARTMARSAPGGATAIGRVRSAGATSPSTVVQKAGGSTNRTERGGR